MPEIRNDGVGISYDVAGEGRPLVRCTAAAARLVQRSVVVDRAVVRRGAQGDHGSSWSTSVVTVRDKPHEAPPG